MIAIVTPNNPTGLCATPDDLREIALAAPDALILLDMAYAEFADEPHLAAMQDQALRHDNVLITDYPLYAELSSWMLTHVPKGKE
jgi:histidinol-phosphate/aromatic aminotransferase/cobyric acid decarboxylase-like protein